MDRWCGDLDDLVYSMKFNLTLTVVILRSLRLVYMLFSNREKYSYQLLYGLLLPDIMLMFTKNSNLQGWNKWSLTHVICKNNDDTAVVGPKVKDCTTWKWRKSCLIIHQGGITHTYINCNYCYVCTWKTTGKLHDGYYASLITCIFIHLNQSIDTGKESINLRTEPLLPMDIYIVYF